MLSVENGSIVAYLLVLLEARLCFWGGKDF